MSVTGKCLTWGRVPSMKRAYEAMPEWMPLQLLGVDAI